MKDNYEPIRKMKSVLVYGRFSVLKCLSFSEIRIDGASRCMISKISV